MCGIFFYGAKTPIKGTNKKQIESKFSLLKHRGPDGSRIRYYNANVMVGFHRLQIVDPTPSGMQPFASKNGRFVSLTNGEIYNFNEIKREIVKCEKCSYAPVSDSDCESIVHFFEHSLHQVKGEISFKRKFEIAMEKLCDKLDGEYALIIYDIESQLVGFAVDELRVRPLFYAVDKERNFILASEQKAFEGIKSAFPVPSGTHGVVSVSMENNGFAAKDFKIKFHPHFDFDHYRRLTAFKNITYDEAKHTLRKLIVDNINKKLNPERDFAFLLSGGLDSSLVCSVASRLLAPHRIKTFAFGFSEDSPDVIAARKMASFLDSIHTTYILNFDQGASLVEEVIYHGESWDQTTTRASVAMLLGLKRMKAEHPGIAVLFSGEVSDELLRGYLYNMNSPNAIEGRLDAIDRLQKITYFDGLRADRMVSSISCELRLPFFSKTLLDFVLTLPPEFLDPSSCDGVEKKLLRDAFWLDEEGVPLNYLPEELLWRTKNALSDATSVKSTWKDHLKSRAEAEVETSRFSARRALYSHCPPETREDMWYREIFDGFGFNERAVPEKWMPSWAEKGLVDSSATVLDVFREG